MSFENLHNAHKHINKRDLTVNSICELRRTFRSSKMGGYRARILDRGVDYGKLPFLCIISYPPGIRTRAQALPLQNTVELHPRSDGNN